LIKDADRSTETFEFRAPEAVDAFLLLNGENSAGIANSGTDTGKDNSGDAQLNLGPIRDFLGPFSSVK